MPMYHNAWFTKLKRFCIAKTTVSKIKSQTKNWEKPFSTHIMNVSFCKLPETNMTEINNMAEQWADEEIQAPLNISSSLPENERNEI